MERERRPSFWRAMGREIANDIKASQEGARRRVKTLSNIFASPWSEKSRTGEGLENAPRRRTLQNLQVFFRNNEIVPKAFRQIVEEDDEHLDKAIMILVGCTIFLGLIVVAFFLLK